LESSSHHPKMRPAPAVESGMQILDTKLRDVKLIRPQKYGDDRGWFSEMFNSRAFAAAGLPDHFVQDNQSFSQRGVLRGLHYQLQQPQGKLIRVLSGHIWDVAPTRGILASGPASTCAKMRSSLSGSPRDSRTASSSSPRRPTCCTRPRTFIFRQGSAACVGTTRPSASRGHWRGSKLRSSQQKTLREVFCRTLNYLHPSSHPISLRKACVRSDSLASPLHAGKQLLHDLVRRGLPRWHFEFQRACQLFAV